MTTLHRGARLLVQIRLEIIIPKRLTEIFSIFHHRLAPLVVRHVVIAHRVDHRNLQGIQDRFIDPFEFTDSFLVGIVNQVSSDKHSVQAIRVHLGSLC